MAELTDAQSRLIDEAAATSAGSASLSDIQHVVILMQSHAPVTYPCGYRWFPAY